MDLTKPLRTRSGSDVDGNWTQIRRDALPMGDALYTIQEIPENQMMQSETEIETVLVNGSVIASPDISTSSNSTASSFNNAAPACSSSALSDAPPADMAGLAPKSDRKTVNAGRVVKDLIDPRQRLPSGGGDLDLKTISSQSEMSLSYWKSRLEVMENKRRDMRQWMAETTLKISETVKRMKMVTERLHQGFNDGSLEEDSVLTKPNSVDTRLTENESIHTNVGLPFRSTSSFATSQFSQKPTSPATSLSDMSSKNEDIKQKSKNLNDEPQRAKSRGSSGDGLSICKRLDANKEKIIEKDEGKVTSSKSDLSISAYPSVFMNINSLKENGNLPELTFEALPNDQKQAEEMLRREKQLPFLKMMADLTDEWDLVKSLYISLKRIGKILPVQVLELSRSVSEKNAQLRENMKNFLISERMNPAEMMYSFGRDLLTVYHITLILSGERISRDLSPTGKSTRSNASSRSKKRKYSDKPLTKSRKSQRPSSRTDRSKTAERIIRKQNEIINKMFQNPSLKVHVPTNPSYAHVKSRYLEPFLQRRKPVNPSQAKTQKPKTSCVDQRPKVKILSSYERARSGWSSSSRINLNKEEWDYEDKSEFVSGATTISNKPSFHKDRIPLVKVRSPLSIISSSSSSSHCNRSTETVVKRDVTRVIRKGSESPYRSADDTADMVNLSETAADELTRDPLTNETADCVTQSSLDLSAHDVFGDFSCGDSNQLFFERFGDRKRKDTSKTKMTITNNVKPMWKLTSTRSKHGAGKEIPLARTATRIFESNRPNSRASAEEISYRCQPGSKVPTFAVVAKDKYVCVKLTGRNADNRDSSPTRYDPADDAKNVGVIRTLYRNLPSLRPYIVDMLLTNIVFAYLISIAGDTLFRSGTQAKVACNISEVLKNKLRSILIRALRLVDDF